ncbi:MAG: nitroreductase family protein [Candidatus Kapabacteria bacterium]|nr:nitroreductase family protein [Ignavibacteriota bacterium]MCW5885975.1 nitroreductase family protein [Candidatus Kapabacteria bacterium]
MITKLALTEEPIHDLISRRWSLRAFDINKPVAREQIISICEAGRWAPSCFGDEPWRFMVWDIYHDENAYMRAFNCIGEWNQRWVKTAPVIITSFADDRFRLNGEPNRWAQHDTGLATQNILLQAFALGLAAHPLGGFDGDKIKKEFSIDERFTAMACIAIGYQAGSDVLDDDHAKDELKPRLRRQLGTTFFDSYWENGIINANEENK